MSLNSVVNSRKAAQPLIELILKLLRVFLLNRYLQPRHRAKALMADVHTIAKLSEMWVTIMCMFSSYIYLCEFV